MPVDIYFEKKSNNLTADRTERPDVIDTKKQVTGV